MQGIELIEYRCLDHDKMPGDLTRTAAEPTLSAGEARSKMLALYRNLPYAFRDAYRELFQHLANADLPMVFNCTAGKDRTGGAAALILTALGVDRDSVFEDYLLTMQCFERSHDIVRSIAHIAGVGEVEREVWDVILSADSAYLEAMFGQLEAEHGHVSNYFTRELGIDAASLDAMQRHLLE